MMTSVIVDDEDAILRVCAESGTYWGGGRGSRVIAGLSLCLMFWGREICVEVN